MSSHSSADVVEGLIREYLVRNGLQETLVAFNSERPKHSNSISKREVLRRELGLERAAAKYKSNNPEIASLPPTIELWAIYQMSKVGSSANSVPQGLSQKAALTNNNTEPDSCSAPVSSNTSNGASRRTAAAPGGIPNAGSCRNTAMESSAVPGLKPDKIRASWSPAAEDSNVSRAAKGLSALALQPDEDDADACSQPEAYVPTTRRSVRSAGSSSTTATAPAKQQPAAVMTQPAQSQSMDRHRQQQHTNGSDLQQKPSMGFIQQPQARAPDVAAPAAVSRRQQATSRAAEVVIEDVDDVDLGDDADMQDLLVPPSGGRLGQVPRAAAVTGRPLSPDQGRSITSLLWGDQGASPASWKQGFYFNTRPGLTFGLVQREGGPCGILASVQAFILTHLLRSNSTGNSGLNPRPADQQAALVAALTDIIWQSRVGPVAWLVVPGPECRGSTATMSYDALTRAVVLQEASSREQLQEALQRSVGSYCEPQGWGLLLLLLSVITSHGVSAVRQDMDVPNTALMGMHGYCTQELVNLLVAGQAVSNVFDGHKDLDGTTLKGITRKCRVGLLTLFEWYKYVEVGRCLKRPEMPVWVVCSESHFTVLFSQDGAAARDSLPFQLQYYDELANQQAPILLTVTSDPAGGLTAKVGDTVGDRGKCEGQHIPPLECVIETRWPGVRVDWNGSEPIL